MEAAHHHCEEWCAEIEQGIADAEAITVQDAIVQAILAHRMTAEEGKECLEAFERTFS